MPLAASAQALLAQVPPVDWTTMTPQGFRAASAAMVRPADPDDRVSGVDLDAGGVRARLYRPIEREDILPALVFCHGGGYIACGIESHERLCHRLARLAGCAILSLDYRLAPEHVFPAAVDDAWAGLCWLAGHAADHRLDPARIAVGGDSAGGTLATVAALRARDAGGPALVHQLLIYPGTDLVGETESERLFSKGYFLDADFASLCLDAYLPDRADRAHPWASPLRADDLSGLPPATILTAECDPLRDEGHAYADRLRAAGVAVETVCYAGMFHGFASMSGMIAEADDAVGKAAAALRAAFAGRAATSSQGDGA